MIKSVIFDLDGTLLDTREDLLAAHNHALGSLGYPERSLDEINYIVGGGILEAIRRAAPEGVSREIVLKLNEVYQSYYPEHCAEKTRPYEGMTETLTELERAGIKLAVLTNKTEVTAQKLIKHYFPDTRFEFVWGNDGYRPLKPEPDSAFAAGCALKMRGADIAYVGDIASDMSFSRAAGLYAVGAAWGFRGRAELEEAGADFIAETPAQLLELL